MTEQEAKREGCRGALRKAVSSGLLPLGLALAAGPVILLLPRWRLGLLACLTILWASGRVRQPGLGRKTPLDGALAFLLGWICLGSIAAPASVVSGAKLSGLIYGVLLFSFLVSALKKRGPIRLALAAFLAGGLFLAILGTFNRYDSPKAFGILPRIEMRMDRAEGGINPNPLGGALLFVFPLGLTLAPILAKKPPGEKKAARRRLRTGALVLALGVELAVFVYVNSMGVWLAVGFSALWAWRRRRILPLLAVLAVVAAGLFLVPGSPARIDRAAWTGFVSSLHESVDSRIPGWRGGLESVAGHPVFGVGLDQLRRTPLLTYEYAHAHNQLLQVAAESGIPALLAYLAILACLGRMALAVGRSGMPAWMIASMRGLGLGQVGFHIFGLVDAFGLGAKAGTVFWVSIGLMTSIYLYGRDHGMLRPQDGSSPRPLWKARFRPGPVS